MSLWEEFIIAQINEYLGNTTLEGLRRKNNYKIKFPVYLTLRFYSRSIDYLELSTRPYNGLMRAGFKTIGQLVDNITTSEDLSRIRGMGQLSIQEIMLHIFLYQFSSLPEEKRKGYIKRFKELNL